MKLNRPIRAQDIQNIFDYLTRKWWLPVSLVCISLTYAVLGSIVLVFLVNLLGGNPLVIFGIGIFNGMIYFASLAVMLAVGVHQINNKIYILGLFNLFLSWAIFLGIGYLGMGIT